MESGFCGGALAVLPRPLFDNLNVTQHNRLQLGVFSIFPADISSFSRYINKYAGNWCRCDDFHFCDFCGDYAESWGCSRSLYSVLLKCRFRCL